MIVALCCLGTGHAICNPAMRERTPTSGLTTLLILAVIGAATYLILTHIAHWTWNR